MLKRRGIVFVFILFFKFAFCAENKPLELEPIIVSKFKPYFLNSFSVDSQEFSDSVIESLEVLPIDLQSRSSNEGIQIDFSLRGSNFQGVLVLFNGRRINDPQTGHHNSDIPLTKADVSRIDLIPGISSSFFGPDAIGGAVNFIVKKPQARSFILEGTYGSFSTKSALISLTEKIKDFSFRLSSDYARSNGFSYDTDFKKRTATLSSFWDAPFGGAKLDFGYQDKEFGAYDFYTPGLGYPSREWTKTYLLDAGLNLESDGLSIKPDFLWRRHKDEFMLDETQRRSKFLSQHRTDMYTPKIYLQKESVFLGSWGFGLEYGREEIHSTTLGKHARNYQSIFFDDTKEFNSSFSLAGSFRVDNFDNFGASPTGSLNFKYRIKEYHSLSAGVSRSIRVPTFTELYYNDPTTIGDPRLAQEESLTYQLGYNYKKEYFSLGLTPFFRQDKDTIDWVKSSPAQAKWQAQNIGEAGVLGFEFYLSRQFGKNFILSSDYSYINKHIDRGSYIYKYGQNYCRHLANVAATFNLPFGKQEMSLTYKRKPGRYGWLLLNSRFSYNIQKYALIFLDIKNMLGIKYEEIAGIPQPGRSLEGGLRLEW
jgi:vitamin B12 transporter